MPDEDGVYTTLHFLSLIAGPQLFPGGGADFFVWSRTGGRRAQFVDYESVAFCDPLWFGKLVVMGHAADALMAEAAVVGFDPDEH